MSEDLLDRHNDLIVVYSEKWGDSVRITDDHYIVLDLEICGIDIPDDIFSSVLKKYGVSIENGELFIMHDENETSSEEYKRKVDSLRHCIHELSNMY